MPKKIKVLQFSVSNSLGGRTSYQLMNWKYIDKSKFQFDFVTMEDHLAYEEDLRRQGCTVHHISTYAEEDKNSFGTQFRQILTHGDYDIVHLHTARWRGLVAEEIAKDCGVKRIIVHAHSSGIDVLDPKQREEQERLHYNVREKLTPEIATDYWACSKKAADFLYGERIPVDRIRIMNNAIDLSKYEYNEHIRKKIRNELGYSDECMVIGNVGRLVYPKNQEFLIDLVHNLVQIDNRFRLLLVGDGIKRGEYEDRIRSLDLDNYVQMVGYKSNVQDYLQAMDCFSLPSRFEGFPLSIIEAQASGLRCIVSEAVTDEVNSTGTVELLPLDIAIWKKRIENMSEYMDRGSKGLLSDLSRYDIRYQIKILENAYLAKTNT